MLYYSLGFLCSCWSLERSTLKTLVLSTSPGILLSGMHLWTGDYNDSCVYSPSTGGPFDRRRGKGEEVYNMGASPATPNWCYECIYR